MPKVGNKQENYLRLFDCINQMWEDYSSGKISYDSLNLRFYESKYRKQLRKDLILPVLQKPTRPNPRDIIELQAKLHEWRKEKNRRREMKEREEGPNLFSQSTEVIAASTDPAITEPTESELIMKVISLGYAVFKPNN